MDNIGQNVRIMKQYGPKLKCNIEEGMQRTFYRPSGEMQKCNSSTIMGWRQTRHAMGHNDDCKDVVSADELCKWIAN